jgi:hypothetical protein
MYRRFGLPSGRGWLEEPGAVLELLDLFDSAMDSLDRRKAEKKEPSLCPPK